MYKKNSGISLVINTKNEEKNIKDCILSAKDIVDEIIVVDMQSSDKTIQLAKELGAKTYSVKDYGFADPARNFALSKATLEWTLTLDADERLTEELRRKIVRLIKDSSYDGYKFPFKNILLGKWIKHSMWWPDYHLRLFRTGCLNWPAKVHQEPNFTGKLFQLDPLEKNAVVHYNISDINELLKMVDQYSSVEHTFKSKKNITPDDMVRYLNHEFRWRYLEHQGYLDGMHGFILGKFMDVYRLLEVAKFWEKHGYKEMFAPINLKKAVENNLSSDEETGVLRKEVERLRDDLEKIQSAKFYKLWQSYCKIRDKIL
ncbi:MAG: glycosyltransferase family 2 protein [Candidatus Levybacteria bacterium]|nr:glycosyltransferase family 2 protein [Candidatus Levybacteria bacterium]